DLLVGPADVGRPAGQDLAQDGAQAEHVTAAVEQGDVALGLLRRHVRRRAQQTAGLGVRPGAGAAAARRADLRALVLVLPAGPLLVGQAALSQHLGQAP